MNNVLEGRRILSISSVAEAEIWMRGRGSGQAFGRQDSSTRKVNATILSFVAILFYRFFHLVYCLQCSVVIAQ